jgi:ribosomal protein S18 acetylase RimI-like enzyme
MEGMNNIAVRKATSTDAELVHWICRKSYAENFAGHWHESGLDWYFNKVYSHEGIRKELDGEKISYFVVFAGEEPIGFIKLNLESGLPGVPAEESVEIEKIYFLPAHQGQGIGKRLISMAAELAASLKKKWLWLGVLTSNEKALAFYQKSGFTIHDRVTLEFPLLKEQHRPMWRMTKRIDG